MKILFIIPPQEGFFHTAERHYPIGLFYLAEACKQKNHEIAILDCLVYKNIPYVIPPSELSCIQKEKISHNPIFDTYVHYGTTWEDIESYIAMTRPNVIALSVMFSCFYDSAYALAANIKKKFPEVVTIAGGAHISILYRHALNNAHIDYCLRYEGENTLPLLLDKLSVNENPYDIPGIAFRDSLHPNNATMNGTPIYCNESIAWIRDLNEKLPAYDLIDYSQYDNTVTLITSRGCPYECSFCAVRYSMGQTFRIRSVENVVAEIEEYYSLGVRNFNIEDDNFSLDMERVEGIFRALIQKNICANFYLLNGIIARNITAKSMNIFAKAGVKKLFFGLETTSTQRLQEVQKKHTSLDIVKGAICAAEENHIQAGVSLIMGFPHQSLEELLKEIATLINCNILILAINPLYPVPGTQMYRKCISEGILTGREDFITLGGDNFPIHNESLSQVDMYYLWVAIRALCKWNSENSHYLSFENIQILDCLKLIAYKIGNCTVESAGLDFKLHVPSYQLHNQIYSAGHKILSDMIASMVYIRTGNLITCTCLEEENNFVFCVQMQTDKAVPYAIYRLRLIILELQNAKE